MDPIEVIEQTYEDLRAEEIAFVEDYDAMIEQRMAEEEANYLSEDSYWFDDEEEEDEDFCTSADYDSFDFDMLDSADPEEDPYG